MNPGEAPRRLDLTDSHVYRLTSVTTGSLPDGTAAIVLSALPTVPADPHPEFTIHVVVPIDPYGLQLAALIENRKGESG